MTAWIVGVAIFYTFAMAYLGFEMWRAPLVDDKGNVLPDDNTAQFHTMRLRRVRN